MRTLCLTIVLLWATVAHAKELQTALISRSVQSGSRVAVVQGSGVLCGGTPDLGKRLVLSVYHVTGPTGTKVDCFIRKGYRHAGTVIGHNVHMDLSLIMVNGTSLESIPSARLYMGEITNTMRTRTEGYPSGTFQAVNSRPVHIHDNQLVFAGPTRSGASGGPQYVLGTGGKHYLTVTSKSNFVSTSIGPYRTAIKDFVETCSTPVTIDNFGQMQVRPRRLEGPIAVPEPPPAETASDKKEELNSLLAEIESELKKSKAKQAKSIVKVQPKPTPATPVQQPNADFADGEVITIKVPVKLRVNITERIQLEVVE